MSVKSKIIQYVGDNPMSSVEQIAQQVIALDIEDLVETMIDDGELYRTITGKIFIPKSRIKKKQ